VLRYGMAIQASCASSSNIQIDSTDLALEKLPWPS
jgi:hypothetical protein